MFCQQDMGRFIVEEIDQYDVKTPIAELAAGIPAEICGLWKIERGERVVQVNDMAFGVQAHQLPFYGANQVILRTYIACQGY